MARQLLAAAINVLRDAHYVLNPVTGLYERTTLVEGIATNLALQSENLGVTWTLLGTPTRTAAAIPSSVMGVALDLIGDDDAVTLSEGYQQTITFTGDGAKGISVHVKKGTAPSANGSQIVLRDTTAAVNRLLATLTWDAFGVPSVAIPTGLHLGTPVAYTSGIYRPRFQAPGVIAANTNVLQLLPTRQSTGTDTGDLYIGGMQAENNVVPTSYKATTTATVARGADVWNYPFTLAPQEMTLYAKFIEQGTLLGKNFLRVLQIGNTANAAPKLLVYGGSGGSYSVEHNTPTSVTASVNSTGVNFGDQVELRIGLRASGAVYIGISVNGGTEIVSGDSAATPLMPAWSATPAISIGGVGGAGTGFNAFQTVRVLRGTQSLATCRAA